MILPVTVVRVLYPPAVTPDARWFVLLTDQGKCSGTMTWRPLEGENLKLDGKYSAYKGERQFQFTNAMPNVPVDPRAQLRYVCARAKGLGPAMEEAIWAARGNQWTAVQQGEVPRLTGARWTEFQDAVGLLEREAEKSEAITWLLSKGTTMNMASAAWEQWNAKTMHVVQDNPFRLADLPHYSFNHVDTDIREAFGIDHDDLRRIRAAVLYAIRQLTSNGSTVIEWTEVRDGAARLVGWDHIALCVEATKEMFTDGSLMSFPGTESIALSEDYNAERAIWDFVHAA